MVSEQPDINSPGENISITQPQDSPLNIIEEARKERLALEKLRDELKIQNQQMMELHAKNIMAGSAIAGQAPPKPKTNDDIAEEMAADTIKKLFNQRG